MKKSGAMLLALIVGFGLGYLAFNGDDYKDKDSDINMSHNDMSMDEENHNDDSSHSHGETMDFVGESAPMVSLEVHKDNISGYNAEISLSNFTLAPESVSTDHVDGEGHAHIYVNGVKINRVYSNWYHLGTLSEGDEVSVRLSTNDHKEIMVDGLLLSDVVVVE